MANLSNAATIIRNLKEQQYDEFKMNLHNTFLILSMHNKPSGPVQVQTLEEPELDLKSGSLEVRFRFTKICEPDPKSGSGFGEMYPQTRLNQTAASLVGRQQDIYK